MAGRQYKQTYQPDHPRATASGCVQEHMLIAEKALGRYLPSGAVVHHVDSDRRNNTPGNLVICQDQAHHILLHIRTRVLQAGGNPNTERRCSTCRRLLPFATFNRRAASVGYPLQTACRSCQSAYCRTYVRPSERKSPGEVDLDAYAELSA